MPEEADVETDGLRERITEPPAGVLLRNIALTTALLAALGAVAALRAGDTVNEALVLKTEAGRLQAEASDQWAYYQAKGIKANVEATARAVWQAAGKMPPANVEASIQRSATEQQDSERVARAKERERDDKSKEADQLLDQSGWAPWRWVSSAQRLFRHAGDVKYSSATTSPAAATCAMRRGGSIPMRPR